MSEFRLHYGLVNNTYVIARDRARGKVLLGGLGALGVGQMWADEDGHHQTLPGWDYAPDWNSSPVTEPPATKGIVAVAQEDIPAGASITIDARTGKARVARQ